MGDGEGRNSAGPTSEQATISSAHFTAHVVNNIDFVLKTKDFGIGLASDQGFITIQRDKVLEKRFRYQLQKQENIRKVDPIDRMQVKDPFRIITKTEHRTKTSSANGNPKREPKNAHASKSGIPPSKTHPFSHIPSLQSSSQKPPQRKRPNNSQKRHPKKRRRPPPKNIQNQYPTPLPATTNSHPNALPSSSKALSYVLNSSSITSLTCGPSLKVSLT